MTDWTLCSAFVRITRARRRELDAADQEQLTARLYQEIGQLKVELDWLKKKSGLLD